MRCKLICSFLGWNHGMPLAACEACAADSLAPRSLGSAFCRQTIARVLHARIVGHHEWKDQPGVTKTFDESVDAFAHMTGPKALARTLVQAVSKGMPVDKALAIATKHGIDVDAET